MSNSLWPHGLQHGRLPCASLSPRVCSNSCPLSQRCHPTSHSVTPFSSCPQSLPASGSFPMSQLFTSGGQSIGASASVLLMNIQRWFPLGLIGLISLFSKGLPRAFFNTTVQFSCSVVSNSLRPHRLQHVRLPCPSPTLTACSNSYPSSQWYHPTISSSVIPFSSAFNLSQHPDLFQGVSSSHQVAKVLEFQLQHQSFQWIFRTDFL